jgi:hypothetical protein
MDFQAAATESLARSPPRRGRGTLSKRTSVGSRDSLDLMLVGLDVPRCRPTLQVKDRHRARTKRHLRVLRDHVAVEVREALAHGGGVDSQRTGHLLKDALKVTQRETNIGRLSVVKVCRTGNVALSVEHHPARHAVGRRGMTDQPQIVLEDDATG